ncbi:MAG: DUF2116 family Zn-ribbon domain-containing protein [Clostridia bacterium]|nr:DUF2116 family Zn-ribbon domain-containing protein [Clostridia bacterium]
MKICEFCGKELDYDHAFCDEECENNTFIYYKKRKQFQTCFNVTSIICFAVIMLGTFIGLIAQNLKLGLIIVGSAVLLLGTVYIIIPYYGLDEQIRNKGIKTCLKTTRMISAAVLIVGAVCLTLGIIVPF